MENVGFGDLLDTIGEPGQHISLFNAADPFVHKRMFGIARFDLNPACGFHAHWSRGEAWPGCRSRRIKRTPTRSTTGRELGNKRCEFWHFDLAGIGSQTLRSSLAGRDFSFGMAATARNCIFTARIRDRSLRCRDAEV